MSAPKGTAVPVAEAVEDIDYLIEVLKTPRVRRRFQKWYVRGGDVGDYLGFNAKGKGMDSGREIHFKKQIGAATNDLWVMCGSPNYFNSKLVEPVVNVFRQISGLLDKHLYEGMELDDAADAITAPPNVDADKFYFCVATLIAFFNVNNGRNVPNTKDKLAAVLYEHIHGKKLLTPDKKADSSRIGGNGQPKLKIITGG